MTRSCLSNVDIHMFGDSRMRALSFSLMHALSKEVNDTEANLKDLVVPLESASLCGGNKRYVYLCLHMWVHVCVCKQDTNENWG